VHLKAIREMADIINATLCLILTKVLPLLKAILIVTAIICNILIDADREVIFTLLALLLSKTSLVGNYYHSIWQTLRQGITVTEQS
jgi:hypothetical protein